LLAHEHNCGCGCNNDSLILALGQADDPSKTLRLRRDYVAAFNQRWDKVIALIQKSVIDNDAFGFFDPLKHTLLTAQEPLESIPFAAPGIMADTFGVWYDDVSQMIVAEAMLNAAGEVIESSGWQNVYVRSAFLAGMGRAQRRMRRAGVNVTETVNDLMRDPFFRKSLQTLQSANFAAMQTVIEASGEQVEERIRDTLVDSYNKKKTRAQTSRIMNEAIKDRVRKVAKTRSNIIARTEIIRAHSTASLDMYERFGVVELKILLGANPCPICVDLASKTWTIEEARNFENAIDATARVISGSPTFGSQISRLERLRAQNPAWGLIPAHPRCVCSLDVARSN
jgi:hypothetical protein